MIINPQDKDSENPAQAPSQVTLESAEELYGFLAKAAEIAARTGLPPETFTAAAWQAYLAAAPEVAERLAERQFEAALEELRNSGRMAKA